MFACLLLAASALFSLLLLAPLDVQAAPAQDAGVTKSVAPTTSLLPGQPVTYTLTFSHATGVSNAIQLTDTLPVLLTNGRYTMTLDSGVVLSETSPAPTLAWTISNTAPQQGGVITLTGLVSPTLQTDRVLTNTAIYQLQDSIATLASLLLPCWRNRCWQPHKRAW